jgi:hypothetical protein
MKNRPNGARNAESAGADETPRVGATPTAGAPPRHTPPAEVHQQAAAGSGPGYWGAAFRA